MRTPELTQLVTVATVIIGADGVQLTRVHRKARRVADWLKSRTPVKYGLSGRVYIGPPDEYEPPAPEPEHWKAAQLWLTPEGEALLAHRWATLANDVESIPLVDDDAPAPDGVLSVQSPRGDSGGPSPQPVTDLVATLAVAPNAPASRLTS